MSRLIVKNLPNKVTAEKLKEIFGEKGELTDVQLKFTKNGKFRNFAFIGYKREDQAAQAREYFDGTCINSMKIEVQTCVALGDEIKPKAWSKYAPDSTAYKKLHKDGIEQKETSKKERKVEKNKNKIIDLLKKHKDDPLFAEFIEAHVNDKTLWIKDALNLASKSDEEDDDNDVDEKNSENNNEHKNIEENTKDKQKPVKKIADDSISDLEYMKRLMSKVNDSSGTEIKESQDKSETQEPKKIRNRPLFHIKMQGIPFKCKKKDIKQFFRPLVPYTIRMPLGKGKKVSGFCYVGFRTEQELKKALAKDSLYLGNHRVHIQKHEDKAKLAAEEEEKYVEKQRIEKNHSEESIGESGSIFARNLPYMLTEEELTNLFEKYGPIAEVNMPIDPFLRQPKGFATVTFVMPEHAVKAFTELDGTVFCGRMLHLLPGKAQTTNDNDEDLTFKEKKAKKLKALAKSSDNWNVLFLGANAVADVIASNYSTTKEQLLSDNNTSTSAAVRLALGETQLVAETRTFLEKNGVYLDAFNAGGKNRTKRSKTCIIVKNLPANTDKDEIKTLFEKYGQLARVVMPQHGISALVDFIEPFEARSAFFKLTYTKFKGVPLFFEWAPENVFLESAPKTLLEDNKTENERSGPQQQKSFENKERNAVHIENQSNPQQNKIENDVNSKNIDDVIEPEEDEEPENDTTLFVKNLNFKTTEEDLKAHFSEAGKVYSVSIAKKKDPKNTGQLLSMGYGFVQYLRKNDATKALKLIQSSTLDGKTLELKRSERANANEVRTAKKTSKETKQNGTKILVRNVPFQANQQELHEMFKAFGEIKTLRLPKKLTPGAEQHRGFAFIDYYSKADAKSAFEALCQSTHLYGRRLVLEWAEQTDEIENVNVLRKRTAQSFNAPTPGGKKSRKGAVDVEEFVGGDGNDM